MTDRSPALRPLPLRLLSALGALLLLAGTVEVHPPEAHAEIGAAAEFVYTCADGSAGAGHLEAARAAEREQCPVCLQRLQGGAADAPAPALRAGRLPAAPLPPAADPATSTAHPRGQRARAPPVLS